MTPETSPASLAIVREVFRLVRQRVEAMHAVRSDLGMVTPIMLVSADGRPVRLVDGAMIPVDGSVEERPVARTIVVPDLTVDAAMPPARATAIVDWLADADRATATIAASGGAIHLLARAHLLSGGPMWTPGELPADFRAHYPLLRGTEHGAVLDRGTILVSRGLAGDAELMIRLVDRVLAPEMAGWVARRIGSSLVDGEGLSDDPLVADAQVWLGLHYADGPRLSELAATLSVSQQTLLRRFKARLTVTPRAYVRSLRIAAACRQLCHSTRAVAQIATLVGYEDPKAFRHAFFEETGTTATAYRRRCRSGIPADTPD